MSCRALARLGLLLQRAAGSPPGPSWHQRRLAAVPGSCKVSLKSSEEKAPLLVLMLLEDEDEEEEELVTNSKVTSPPAASESSAAALCSSPDASCELGCSCLQRPPAQPVECSCLGCSGHLRSSGAVRALCCRLRGKMCETRSSPVTTSKARSSTDGKGLCGETGLLTCSHSASSP
mmetsp:Transcript_8940/g.19866  ORF Transcript_8940/g.19866 Transcript_8940/m.19866 type:complete len:176 (+) Transcript_8940:382-909(+)